ncbi:hypothetical protein [Entomospira culicis]|uniref:Uncharacterized protein n=1 Tax=Entomospira culicis TaxID=2719989 RepID=A0A968GF30_9SPIO|nr:hypothetical protein [Entomospira culicis]NIZ19217.1 hypothetical protein [Entomospira culicis]NIZ69431.1 hypothetical protein [Entomospira culicis]WDI36547.1 hypothetical protein PVA46_04290 [Entomospira culicis]WDI38173.1 hypothetical protein PVA47_04290 [Entomospira culicis]
MFQFLKKGGVFLALIMVVSCNPKTQAPPPSGSLNLLELMPKTDYAIYMLFGSPPAMQAGMHWQTHNVPSVVWTNRVYQFDPNYIPRNVEIIEDSKLESILLNSGDNLGRDLKNTYTVFEQRIDKLFRENPHATYTVYATDGFLEMVPYFIFSKGIKPEQVVVEILNDMANVSYFYRVNATQAETLFEAHRMEARDFIRSATSNPSGMGTWNSEKLPLGYELSGRFWFISRAVYDGVPFMSRINHRELPFSSWYHSLSSYQRSNLERLMFFDAKEIDKVLFPNGSTKTPIIIAGAYRANPNDSGLIVSEHFEAEMQAILDHFGDQYTYFFKGHPVLPEGSSSERQWMQDKGIHIFPSNTRFPFEFLMFHYSDLIVGGYPTSSYLSASAQQFRFHIGSITDPRLSLMYSWGYWPNLHIIDVSGGRSMFSFDTPHDFNDYYYDPALGVYVLYPNVTSR